MGCSESKDGALTFTNNASNLSETYESSSEYDSESNSATSKDKNNDKVINTQGF
jgi:hypothetical protein